MTGDAATKREEEKPQHEHEDRANPEDSDVPYPPPDHCLVELAPAEDERRGEECDERRPRGSDHDHQCEEHEQAASHSSRPRRTPRRPPRRRRGDSPGRARCCVSSAAPRARPASLCHRVRCRAAMRISDESPSLHLVWHSRRDTRVAIHSSTSAFSQPTLFVLSWQLEGNCPGHSRRQSVVRDSCVRAQTSRHRRRRAGERSACAGCSPVSVASSRTRALLTQLMLRGAESGSQLLLIAPSDSLVWYPDSGDSLIFCQWVRTNYERTESRDAGRLWLHHSSATAICETAIGATVTETGGRV